MPTEMILSRNFLNRSGFYVHSGLWRQTNQDATESIKPDLLISYSISFNWHICFLKFVFGPWSGPLAIFFKSSLMLHCQQDIFCKAVLSTFWILEFWIEVEVVLCFTLILDFRFVILSQSDDCSWRTDILRKTGNRLLRWGSLILCAAPFLSNTRPPLWLWPHLHPLQQGSLILIILHSM